MRHRPSATAAQLWRALPALAACACLAFPAAAEAASAPNKAEEATVKVSDNPFFKPYGTPFDIPPFERIRPEHYLPAFKEGIRRQKAEVAAIAGNAAPATFENTVVALDRSGSLLTRVKRVFFNLLSSNSSPELQAIAKEMAPLLSRHQDDALMDSALFKRVQAVYDARDEVKLDVEQKMVLEKTRLEFVRGGAALDRPRQASLRKLNQELSLLTLKFGDNALKETEGFILEVDKKEDLAGLPPASVEAAAQQAARLKKAGKWVFTLQKPSLIPFLQYADNRELRKRLFTAYTMRGNNGNAEDNKVVLSKIASLRAKRAAVLGYPSHAAYVLEENMAKTPDGVYDLLRRLWAPARKKAVEEAAAMNGQIREGGGAFDLQPWDWFYYAERVKKARYDFDEDALRPYFSLDRVLTGATETARKLWGLTFKERDDLPKYHAEVRTFEVYDADGSFLAIWMVDYFPRPGKRSGAWMDNFRDQYRLPDGSDVRPVVFNCGNFTRPTSDAPALLSLDEVQTLFHEFGHALHGMLSRCVYRKLSGTAVAQDFVELPSQVMENWAMDPKVIKTYALHYKTGEPIPDALLERMRAADKFNQGFATVEYLAASFLDMDWHSLAGPVERDALAFEAESMGRVSLIPEIVPRYRSTYFSHVFSGEYAAGYYSYIWSAVLDSDAFDAFKEAGLFDQKTAKSFRINILEKGGTEDPMELYRRFRGRVPSVDPLLERRGLVAS